VQRLGQVELQAFEADDAADLVEQFGQGAEGAQPAAEEPPAPHEDGDDDEDPEDEDQRIGQEELPLPLEQQAVEPGEHLGDGGLGHGVEAHEADADYPAGVFEGIHRPLVLAVGAAHQLSRLA
jgi:hypothetical protein